MFNATTYLLMVRACFRFSLFVFFAWWLRAEKGTRDSREAQRKEGWARLGFLGSCPGFVLLLGLGVVGHVRCIRGLGFLFVCLVQVY